LLENGSTLFVDEQYHGVDLDNEKNVAYVRPVISWQNGGFSTAIAMESNLVNNAYGYRDASGKWVDQSDRTGYGLTMTWNGQKADPENGTVINLNTAYMDATDEKTSRRASTGYGVSSSWGISTRTTKLTNLTPPVSMQNVKTTAGSPIRVITISIPSMPLISSITS
jgi:hypothetical protein